MIGGGADVGGRGGEQNEHAEQHPPESRRQREGRRCDGVPVCGSRPRALIAALGGGPRGWGLDLPVVGELRVFVSRVPVLVGVRPFRRRGRTEPPGVVCLAGRAADAGQNRPLVLLGHRLVRVPRLVSRIWR